MRSEFALCSEFTLRSDSPTIWANFTRTIGPSGISRLIPQEFSGVTEVKFITPILLRRFGRLFFLFTSTGADAPAAQHRKKNQYRQKNLENTREFPQIITSTGAKVWRRFQLSVLVLVIFSLRQLIP